MLDPEPIKPADMPAWLAAVVLVIMVLAAALLPDL